MLGNMQLLLGNIVVVLAVDIIRSLSLVVSSANTNPKWTRGLRRDKPTNCPSCADNQTLSEYLWEQTENLRQMALNTAYVQGIRTGTLDPVKFGRYSLQDAVWLEESSKSITRAAERMTYETDSELFHIRSYVLQRAQAYFESAVKGYERWHVTGASGIVLNGGGRTFLDYEYQVADTMHVGYYLSCMIPIEKLWGWLGSQLLTDDSATFGAYDTWVRRAFNPSSGHYTELEDYVDKFNNDGVIDEATTLEVYSNCMMGEVDFFEFAA